MALSPGHRLGTSFWGGQVASGGTAPAVRSPRLACAAVEERATRRPGPFWCARAVERGTYPLWQERAHKTKSYPY